MNILRLMLRMLLRDLRAGELTVLGFSLLLAVAALGSVSLLSDRVAQSVSLESRRILGGDVLLTADHPWPSDWREAAGQYGLALAESISFPSMVSGNRGATLAEVKAVTGNYPLRGHLRKADSLNIPDYETSEVPTPGTVWLDERLLSALALQTGDRVQLGQRQFVVQAVLTQEPDRGFNVFAIAPRLLFNRADLESTGLIGFGSRVSYRLHLAGADKAVMAYQQWAMPRLQRGEKLETLDNARPEVRNVLDRADRFLRLAALLAVVLAAVAMGLAADRYLRRHLDACAVLRCLGASGRQVVVIHGGEFLLFGALVTLLGGLLGYAAQALLALLLKGLVAADLPAPGALAWVQTLLVGLVLVVGFALPPLLRLRHVPTVRVLRREWNETDRGSVLVAGAGVVALAALMRWIAGDWLLWAVVLGGFAAAVVVYGGIGWGLLRLLRRAGLSRAAGHGLGWRYGVANLNRHVRSTLLQLVALGLGLTALLLLTVARGDLMGAWQSRVPADAPNRFIINIQPEQQAGVSAFFQQQGLPAPVLEPMVRGRLVSVNDQPITAESYPEERARRLVEREFNLSWTARLPGGNTISGGRWHGSDRQAQFSVEQGLADTLGLKLGDKLTYDIAGNRMDASITSLRKLDWDSMRVNFFVITPPGVLEDFPASYITSFHLPEGRQDVVTALVRTFPNLTLIDVSAVVRQLQDTLDQVSRAVQLVFGFALLAGLAVLYGALQATADERSQELAVLRALGGGSRAVARILLAEFALLGLGAGLLASLGATALATVLALQVFHLNYLPDPLLPLSGIAAGLVLVLSAGWWGTRSARRDSPLQVLREA